ncbi:MAG: GNAT family N-acetyltransferase [Ignavibacteria bacterium]|jgi:ribosomal protein S18 acetylase RimI-like enzyme
MITIKQLSNTGLKTIHEAFINAFSDYVEPINLSFEQLKYMIERRGCDLNLSFGAFSDGQLVSFTLNGIGEWNGELTAYDTGTGTIKEFRKQGIAKRMFNESLPVLREHKVKHYLLEVIRSNKSAFELYKKAGFTITREFDYFISTKDKIKIRESKLNKEFQIMEIINPDWDTLKTFWDFDPSWQNSIDSINRKTQYFKFLGIYDSDKIVGYGIIEKHTGDIPQLAVSREHRRKGLASTLLYRLLQNSESKTIKFINTSAVNNSFRKFAESVCLAPGIGQYEMLLKL